MSKQLWENARDELLSESIENFYDKYGRYPSNTEEYSLEMDITEEQMRERVESLQE